MNNFWIPMALSVLFEVLSETVKNPQSKAKLKKALLKLRNAINTAYFDDPDFQQTTI